MIERDVAEQYGRAEIDPGGEIVAGSHGTWRLTYTAGSSGIAPGGAIRITSECDSDWGIPQFVDPTAAEYTIVEAPDQVRVSVRLLDVKGLRLELGGRGLRPRESVTVVYGDTSHNGPGSRAHTFLEDDHYFWVSVDADGSGKWTKLPDSPRLRIVGDDAVRLVATAPSGVTVGEPFRVLLKAEDRWGNPSGSYAGTVEFSGEGMDAPLPVTLSRDDGGARWVDGFTPTAAGVLRVVAADSANDLEARSNPIVATGEPSEYSLRWADPHGGQVALNSKIAAFFRYARDVSGLHFIGYQRNDSAISTDDWRVQQHEERNFYEPGRFVPVPGFEWSGRTWMGGHHNVYFRRHGQPVRRSSSGANVDPSEGDTDLPHVQDLYRAYRSADVVLTPHVGGGRADLSNHEPALDRALEMASTHGTFEWFLEESLRRGYRMGFIGGSDSHTGRPGDDRPGYQLRRYAHAALAGVYAREITIDGFHEAMKARRVYATSGARIVVGLDAAGHLMGEEFTTPESPEIRVYVAGTAPLESVELFRGLERIYKHQLETPTSPSRVRILWTGASRMTSYAGIVWDGTLTVDGGRIASVEPLRFDSPRSQVYDRDDTSLRWHTWSCGYRQGFDLGIDGDGDAVLHVAVGTRLITGPLFGGHGEDGPRRMSFSPAEGASLSVSLAELAKGPASVDLGILNRSVAFSLAPDGGPETTEFTFTDEDIQPGVNPYWVRVVQQDQEMAWTSPVFVDYAPPVAVTSS